MPINKFKFVSPGVQVAEIDNSQLPNEGVGSGPVIIGRAQRGPAMRPVLVNSFSDFVSTFGMPWPGKDTNDIWRNGNQMAPSYGAYAAQAYLRSSSPLTFVRLLGEENASAGATQAQGAAGWSIGFTSTTLQGGGNYGLFLFESEDAAPTTGTLAAVFYCTGSTVILRGDGIGTTTDTSGTCGLIKTRGTNWELQAQIVDNTGVLDTINFNFDPNSQKYIRNVFNTNPTTTNARISGVSGSEATYFLGETYDGQVGRLTPADTAAEQQCGVILRLADSSASPGYTQNTQLRGATPAESGWIRSQYLGASSSFDPTNTNKVQNLFKVKSLNAGAWESQNFKISISDVAAATSLADPYGTFTVEVRKADDNDNAPQFVERFAPCNLNPTSPNYVARKIGDRYTVWDSDNSRYREYGTYTNNSSYVYVEMAENVTNAMINEALVPFGFDAPPTWNRWSFNSGTLQGALLTQDAYAIGGTGISKTLSPATAIWTDSIAGFTASVEYPQIHFRSTSKQGSPASPGDAYFGYTTGRSSSYNTYDESNIDVMRPFPSGFSSPYGDASDGAQAASLMYGSRVVPNVFTLDELEYLAGSNKVHASWNPGCHVDGDAITVVSGGTWQTVLTKGFDRFSLPLFGGFDGENIVESNPFNSFACSNPEDAETNYAYNSVKMAIDSAADPELVDSNLMAVPGNYCPGLTSHLLSTCEGRADSLAVFELEGGYVPEECEKPTIVAGVPQNRGSITDTIAALKARGMNSSYGATYYPWVQLRDEQSSQLFYAPPSIAAIGTYSSAQQTSEIWFAPAGFTRGGLTDGDAGLPVVGLTERLNSSDRDTLYEANINPIATFPAEGIVIFGQKTLQVTPSALDRVNVRRLMIHVKKEISKMAARLLFDQNVSQTWARFTGQANPFLESIKQRLGLEAYKVVLDTTTTTPDLIDRNIMYAKIFLKPARAIEFIAIDFVITNAGASFED
tara:strand:- start:1302 stop:4202 length:2901 start_codon:yes stop_codon:yes gene_type:complete